MIGLGSAALLAGCGPSTGLGDEPPPKPSPAQIQRLVTGTTAPVYWFGPRLGRYALSEISRRGPGEVGFSYGRFTCAPGSGCSAATSLATRARDMRGLGLQDRDLAREGSARKCWRKLGRAVFLDEGCDPEGYPQEAEVFTGTRMIFVESLEEHNNETPAYQVARRLKPLNAHAPWPLPAPRRLSCRERAAVPSRYRAHMPASLGPRKTC
jgi:hypothetical protein